MRQRDERRPACEGCGRVGRILDSDGLCHECWANRLAEEALTTEQVAKQTIVRPGEDDRP